MSGVASERSSSGRRDGGQDRGRTSGLWLVVVAGATVLGGCSDALSPGAASPGAPSYSAALARGPFVSNAVRYRDSGGRPTTGRSGNAAASVLAIADGTGRTEVHVAAHEVAGAPGGRASLVQVQLKGYDADGRLRFTRNHSLAPGTPHATYVVGGLGRGGQVQVQALVRGADARRTGVVTVTADVLMGANLRVESLAAPLRVAASTMVGISALIRETSGGMGAQAHCALYVDGQEVDRAWGIWVDAGGAVSCVFAHMFRDPGMVPVEVRLLDIQPRDSDASDNSASAMVEVITVPSAFQFDARFEDRTFESASRSEGSWQPAQGGWGYEYGDEYESSGRTQDAYLWAWMPRAVAFPLAELFVRQYTRDETAHGALFTNLDADWSYADAFEERSCASRYWDDTNGRAWLELCSLALGGGAFAVTYLSYSRYAGDVAYRSRGHNRYWNSELGIEDVYSWNYDGHDTFGRFVSYGAQYGLYARIEDAQGLYTANPMIWLEPFAEAYDAPRECGEWADEYGTSSWCYESRHNASGRRGWVIGAPTY